MNKLNYKLYVNKNIFSEKGGGSIYDLFKGILPVFMRDGGVRVVL